MSGNIIKCAATTQIELKEGDFKKIKNFDPNDSIFETLGMNDYNTLTFIPKEGNVVKWFEDKKSGLTYAFMTDKNDKIIAGTIIEYDGDHSNSGVRYLAPKDALAKTMAAVEYTGDDKDKEAIKDFIKGKAKDNSNGLEVTSVLKSDLLHASNGFASHDISTDNTYKSFGTGVKKDPLQI